MPFAFLFCHERAALHKEYKSERHESLQELYEGACCTSFPKKYIMEVYMSRIVAAAVCMGIAAIVFTGHSSSAAPLDDPGVNWRQHRQAQRIGQGIRSGSLTPREAWRLKRQFARTARHEAYFKSDGIFTWRERARIHRELYRTGRHICWQKHDRQRIHRY